MDDLYGFILHLKTAKQSTVKLCEMGEDITKLRKIARRFLERPGPRWEWFPWDQRLFEIRKVFKMFEGKGIE